MKKMARGTMVALVLIGLTACVHDPQADVNNDDFNRLASYPEVAWVKAGPDSTAVYFRLINDFGYGTPTHLTLSDVTGPIVVTHDTLFRSYYTDSDTTKAPVPYIDGHLQRYFVKKPTPGEGSFKVTASNGVSTVVRFRIEAADLGNLPTRTATVGQNITLTAPPFQKFTQDALVQYQRGARPVGFPTATDALRAGTATSAGPVVARAADGSTLTFRAAADMIGLISVTKTVPTHSGVDPNFTPVALASLDTLKVPGYGSPRVVDYTNGLVTDTVTTVGATFTVGGVASTAPNPGDEVTVNLGSLPGSLGTALGNIPFAFLATTRIFIGGIEAGIVHTAVDPAAAAIGADSNSVKILVPAHLTPTLPATSLPVTLTNAALNFDPTFLFGTTAAATTATQAGTPVILKLGTLLSTGNTAPATNYAGTTSRATAPVIPRISIFPTPAANARSIMINDAGAFTAAGDCTLTAGTPAVSIFITSPAVVPLGCKIYKLALETSRIYDVEVRWPTPTSARIGVYTMPDIGVTSAAAIGTIPAAATATGVHVVQTATVTAVNGQYLVVVLLSGTAPAWTSVRLTSR